MRHEAIYKVYPDCIGITDGVGVYGVDDKLIEVDETLVQSKIKELKALEPMRLLRIERNRRLAETDWMALNDVTVSVEWKTYRQALRDLPATAEPQLDENGQLTNVTWPEVPE